MSQPREMYSFVCVSTVYSVTSADTAQTYLGVTYAPVAIGRDNISLEDSTASATLNVSFDMDNTFAQGWLQNQSDNVLVLSIFSTDIDTGVTSVIWKGRLTQIKPDLVAITMQFESIYSSIKNAGLRPQYQLQCRHVLYGRGCGLATSPFAKAGTISAVSGNTLTVAVCATLPDGTYTGGMIQTPDGTLRFITSHTGSTITVIRSNTAFEATLPISVTVFPGCDRSVQTCASRFANILKHGGFPWTPTVNPFGGTSIV